MTLLALGGVVESVRRFAGPRDRGLLLALWTLALPLASAMLSSGREVAVGNFGRYFFPLLPCVVLLGLLALSASAARPSALGRDRRAASSRRRPAAPAARRPGALLARLRIRPLPHLVRQCPRQQRRPGALARTPPAARGAPRGQRRRRFQVPPAEPDPRPRRADDPRGHRAAQGGCRPWSRLRRRPGRASRGAPARLRDRFPGLVSVPRRGTRSAFICCARSRSATTSPWAVR